MIRLHKEHGVNPMLMNCFYCDKPSGIALLGEIRSDVKRGLAEAGAPVGEDGSAPRQGVVLDMEPCRDCMKYMGIGIIVISVDEEKSDDLKNPWRTGGWCVMSEDWARRLVKPPELLESILNRRVAFIPDAVWDRLGLPRSSQESAVT